MALSLILFSLPRSSIPVHALLPYVFPYAA